MNFQSILLLFVGKLIKLCNAMDVDKKTDLGVNLDLDLDLTFDENKDMHLSKWDNTEECTGSNFDTFCNNNADNIHDKADSKGYNELSDLDDYHDYYDYYDNQKFQSFPVTPTAPIHFDPFFHTIPNVEPFVHRNGWYNELPISGIKLSDLLLDEIVGEEENSKEIRNAQNIQDIRVQDIQNIQEFQNIQDVQNVQDNKKENDKRKRSFACSICFKKFARAEHVKRHILSHSQERPFKCSTCNFASSRSDNLAQHSKIHQKY